MEAGPLTMGGGRVRYLPLNGQLVSDFVHPFPFQRGGLPSGFESADFALYIPLIIFDISGG
jgi:hypothetical protein